MREVAIFLGTAGFMELWARWLHRGLWHRSLWWMHRSHHQQRPGVRTRWERNDLLSASHALVAVGLLAAGFFSHSAWSGSLMAIGAGMTAFGLAYVLVHDGIIHGRLPLAFLEQRVPYLQRVAAAHRVHHQARDASPYGLFLGPWELAAQQGTASSTSGRALFVVLAALPLMLGCGGRVPQAAACERFVQCIGKLDAQRGTATNVVRYQPEGGCWNSALAAELCTPSCERGIEVLESAYALGCEGAP
jgi:beta-carotene 3-hydroxylase